MRYLCGLLLWPAAVLAAESRDEFARLSSVVPAEPLAVAYVRAPREIAEHPVLRMVLDEEAPLAARAVQAAAEVFDGPLVVAITGHPLRPDLLGVIVSARVSMEREPFFSALDEKLLGAIGRAGFPSLSLRRIGELASLTIPAPVPVQLTIGYRDGFVLASSNRAVLNEWLSRGDAPAPDAPERFSNSADLKRLVPQGAEFDALLYVNARPIVPVLRGVMPQDPPIFDLLGLSELQAVGVVATRSGRSQSLALSLLHQEELQGPLSWLRPAGGAIGAARLLPPDTPIVLGGKYETAAAGLENVKRLLNMLDGDIVEEFEEERAEFQRDFGFDFQSDFLGNLSGEWIVGARLEPDRFPAVMSAVRVENAYVLQSHLDAMSRAFDLEYDVTAHHGASIVTPRGARLILAYALIDDYWLLGRTPADVAAMIDTWHADESLENTPHFRRTAAELTGASHFAYLNLAPLVKLAWEHANDCDPPDADIRAVMERMAGAPDSALLLAVRPGKDRLQVAFEARGDPKQAGVWDDLCAAFVVPSLTRLRELSKRVVSSSNIRVITAAALTYASAQKGQWPPSLAALIEAGHLSLENLRNPYDGTAPRTIGTADAESYYLYRGDFTGKPDPSVVVVAERELRQGEGANFGFADGHAEFVREPRASELLREFRAVARR